MIIMDLVLVAKDCMKCHKSRCVFDKAEFTRAVNKALRELYESAMICPTGDPDEIQKDFEEEKNYLEELSLKCMDCIGKMPLVFEDIQVYVRTLHFGKDADKPETKSKEGGKIIFSDEKVVDPMNHIN